MLIDDADNLRIVHKCLLCYFGYKVDSMHSVEEALAAFNPDVHKIVMTENTMPKVNGVQLAHLIKSRSPATPILMYTATPPRDCSCLDIVILKPTHFLKVKEELDNLIARGCLIPSMTPTKDGITKNSSCLFQK